MSYNVCVVRTRDVRNVSACYRLLSLFLSLFLVVFQLGSWLLDTFMFFILVLGPWPLVRFSLFFVLLLFFRGQSESVDTGPREREREKERERDETR